MIPVQIVTDAFAHVTVQVGVFARKRLDLMNAIPIAVQIAKERRGGIFCRRALIVGLVVLLVSQVRQKQLQSSVSMYAA